MRGIKPFGRPLKYKEKVQSRSFSLSPKAAEIIDKVPPSERSGLVSLLIEKGIKNGHASTVAPTSTRTS